ncbi:MAG: alpha/beta fold hydrolase, partial [Rhizobiaceae bacterium]
MSYDPSNKPRGFWTTSEFELESGETIRDFKQAFIQHGTPALDGSNVVIVTSSLGGNAHRLDFLIGEGL